MKSITPVLPVRFPFWLAPLGWLATAVAAAAAATAVDIGSRRELFVDGALVERLSGGAGLRLHRPVPREMAIEHDAPWEGTGSGYHSIFKDGDRYRMYYSSYELYLVELAGGAKAGATPKEPHNLCGYAESDDGIHWRKPLLGLHAFNGSKANNIVIASGRFGSVDADAAHPAVFRDDNPAAPTDARYKAILRSREPRGLLAFKSPDGLHWSPMADRPFITDGAFDSQNLAFWDAVRGEYRAYWRYFDQGTPEKPYQGVRSIRTATRTFTSAFRRGTGNADTRTDRTRRTRPASPRRRRIARASSNGPHRCVRCRNSGSANCARPRASATAPR
jgi:hypothetical protein